MTKKPKILIRYHHTEDKSGVPERILKDMGKPQYRTRVLLDLNFDTEVDYILGDEVGIERKEINDLVGSIEEGKIPMQIKKIMDAGLKPVFLVEGILPDSTQSEMEWKSIYGFMGWLSECGIIVEHTIDYAHTSIKILNMALKVQKVEFGVFKVPVIRIKADHPVLQRLMSVPGVGEEIAHRIRSLYSCEFKFLMDCYKMKKNGKCRMLSIDGVGSVLAYQIARHVTKHWDVK